MLRRREIASFQRLAVSVAAGCAVAACHASKPRAPDSRASAAASRVPTAEVTIHEIPDAATPDIDARAGARLSDAGTRDGTAGDGEATPAHEPHPKTDIEIDLERTACFGSCPIYTLELYGDGTVVFKGKSFVERGLHVVHVPPSRVRDLARGLERAGFFTLSWNRHCGKGRATDLPSAISTLRIDGHKRTIDHYRGDQCAPVVLDRWEQRIDKVGGTSRWLETP